MTMATLYSDDSQNNNNNDTDAYLYANYVNDVNDTITSDPPGTGTTFWSVEALSKIAPVLLVMIATIIGNLVLIVLITHKQSRRRKRVNVFIVNLGIADLTVAFITMTTELLEAVFKEWVLGAFLCKALLYLQVVTLSSTTFLLTGMSIDRFQVIVRPLQSITHRPKIKSKVVTAWLMAFVFAVPQIFIFVQVEYFDERKQVFVHGCKSSGYSQEWQRKFYFTFLTFYILLLPAGIMLFCYTAIAVTIWKRGEQTERSAIAPYKNGAMAQRSVCSPRTSMKRSAVSSQRQKVLFMTLSVIIAYLVCLTPYFIICLIRIYSNYSVQLRNELAVSQVIFMLHSALNPILYGLFTFRKSHLKAICSFLMSKAQYKHQVNSNDKTTKPPSRHRFRRGLLCFKDSNDGETSVIIANHVAKEETSIKLKNREKTSSTYMTSFRRANSGNALAHAHANNHNHTSTYSQTTKSRTWGNSVSFSQGSSATSTSSSENIPVCVHATTVVSDNGTAVSDV